MKKVNSDEKNPSGELTGLAIRRNYLDSRCKDRQEAATKILDDIFRTSCLEH